MDENQGHGARVSLIDEGSGLAGRPPSELRSGQRSGANPDRGVRVASYSSRSALPGVSIPTRRFTCDA